MATSNKKAPERVWLNPNSAVACDHSLNPQQGDVEYVRADLLNAALKSVAHPKFTTDEQGQIHYYVTKTDVELARSLIKTIGAAANVTDEADAK